MKLFKLFLGIFSVTFVFSGASAMESKAKESKAPITIPQLPKAILNIILSMVIRETGNNITEAELFQATNNLRLVNKEFNSLIQDYINKQKELKPEVYANLTPAQAYKQFQLDLIDKKIDEFVMRRGSVKNNELIDFAVDNLKAFNWLIEDYTNIKGEDINKDVIARNHANLLERKYKEIENKIIDIFKNSSKEDFKNIDAVLYFIENHKEYRDDKFKELKNLIENYVGLSKIFDKKSSDPIKKLKDLLKFLLLENNWDSTIRWEAYDWLKNSEEGQQLFKNYINALLNNADVERLEKLLDDNRLNIKPDEEKLSAYPGTPKDKNIFQVLILRLAGKLSIDSKNLDLNKFYKTIKLLLSKYNAQANLAQKEIERLKRELKNQESKMSYKAQYTGYYVPENVKALREIVKLLEDAVVKKPAKYGKLEENWEVI